MNNRRFSRVLFSGPVQLKNADATYTGQLQDLSLKGALLQLEAASQLQTGQSFQLQFQLNESGVDLFMDVTVAHLNGTCVGVRCDKIDIDSASHLRRLLELNLGDADLLSRELTELSE
jgi:PilZ domain